MGLEVNEGEWRPENVQEDDKEGEREKYLLRLFKKKKNELWVFVALWGKMKSYNWLQEMRGHDRVWECEEMQEGVMYEGIWR